MGEELTEGKIMRKSCGLLVGLVLTFGTASLGHAAVVEWSGTLIVSVGDLPRYSPRWFEHYGTGVATVNGSAGGIGHINTISIASGLTFTGGNNVPEAISITDPNIPTLISLRMTGARIGKVVHTSGTALSTVTAVWNGISGGPPLGTKNTGRPPGQMKMCILFAGCKHYLPIPFGTIWNSNAVGVGGVLTVNTFLKGNGFKLSMQGAPWTIGLASIRSVTIETPNGAITTYTKTLQGFVHGPGSATSNTAAISGVLQIVTPLFIETNLGAPRTFQAWWFELRLHFIPEPGLLLLLGANLAALVMIGRKRMEP